MRKMSALSSGRPCNGLGVSQEDWWGLGARLWVWVIGPPPFLCESLGKAFSRHTPGMEAHSSQPGCGVHSCL